MPHDPERLPGPHANDVLRFRAPRFDDMRAIISGYTGLLPSGLATTHGRARCRSAAETNR